jgi:chromate transport protein ChrA
VCAAPRLVDRHRLRDSIAATNLLPGPASTQLAILCAWRLRGALVGGLCFIVPGLVLILALAALFLSARPPWWVLGAAAGAGAAVPAVAVHTAAGLIPASWRRAGTGTAARVRWIAYLVAGAVGAGLIGPWLVLVLIGAGLTEIAVRAPASRRSTMPLFVAMPAVATTGGLLAVAWWRQGRRVVLRRRFPPPGHHRRWSLASRRSPPSSFIGLPTARDSSWRQGGRLGAGAVTDVHGDCHCMRCPTRVPVSAGFLFRL